MREKIRDYLEEEITKNKLESVWVQVSQNGDTLLKEAFGTSSVGAIFDAGSLVEVVAILPAILKLVERRKKKLALNHILAEYLPEFKQQGKEHIQIMNLLTQTSGLPYVKDFKMEDITHTELVFQPGSRVVYSPLNMQLLPQIYELVSDFTFEQFLEDFIFNPLLMTNTEIEQDKKRRYHLKTTLADLSHYASMIEQNGTYDYLKIINKKTMLLSKQNFTSFLNAYHGLGWELQKEDAPAGPLFSQESYGFMGPDGMSMWFDPKMKLNIILKLEGFEDSNELQRMRLAIYQLIREGI